MKPNKEEIQNIARDIEKKWMMGGLSDGMYFDYGYEILCEYLTGRTHNSSFIGQKAGENVKGGYGVVIIGDGLVDLENKENVESILIGNQLLIGTKLFGEHINLKEVIEKNARKYDPDNLSSNPH